MIILILFNSKNGTKDFKLTWGSQSGTQSCPQSCTTPFFFFFFSSPPLHSRWMSLHKRHKFQAVSVSVCVPFDNLNSYWLGNAPLRSSLFKN